MNYWGNGCYWGPQVYAYPQKGKQGEQETGIIPQRQGARKRFKILHNKSPHDLINKKVHPEKSK